MPRNRRAISLLVAYWLAIFAGPTSAAYCAPVTGTQVATNIATCPMKQAAHKDCHCCCAPTAAPASERATFEVAPAALDPCSCSLQPTLPPDNPEAALAPPALAAVTLPPPSRFVTVPPRMTALAQAPVRGPTVSGVSAGLRTPSAGRAPPTTA
ncbi:MAG: hypothetical protein H7Z41_07240 [Cytophagales bacterium]|nr:hypothetical protein [Armatimonadota bacterium]